VRRGAPCAVGWGSAMMRKHYSIFVREYGATGGPELCQLDSNPQAIAEGGA